MSNLFSEIVLLSETYGWKKTKRKNLTLWFKGYLICSDTNQIYLELSKFIESNKFNLQHLTDWCNTLNGHFAIVAIFNNSIFAAVDKVNSSPLFYSSSNNNFSLSSQPSFIKDKNIDEHFDKNSLALLELKMSGYTIGKKTIYDGLYQLGAGECLFYEHQSLITDFYYTYSPWNPIQASENELISSLNNTLNSTFIDLVESIQGRQVVIPLSAGRDSRLIASGLKHFGVENVFCFSYGRKNNFESKIASQISKKLGYDWRHIEINDKRKKEFFKSKKFISYINDFDTFSSIPAIQDIAEICFIKDKKIISEDAIIINGNTGDYISGGHLFKKNPELNIDSLWEEFIKKHYSLWGILNTKANNSLIKAELENIAEIRQFKNILNFNDYPFFFETLEFLGRQSMYVVNQQAAYDFNNLDWRLPFWSDSFVSFWEGVPYEQKLDQKLYSKVLIQNDWGDVWKDFPINDNKIEPKWIIPLRFLSKACLFPFGKDKWHSFERNAFQYWMELTRNCVITPYHRVLLDNKGQKNMFSWLAKDYIEQKK